MAYEYTGQEIFLSAACNLADYFLDRLPEDQIPYWDFDAPIDLDTPRDSSAGAIAAGGMLKLAESEGKSCARYRLAAERILASLSSQYLDYDNRIQGLMNHACYSKPHNEGVGGSFIVGDYFYLQALSQLTSE